MALTPEQQDLQTRCAQALQMGASLARIDTHLANVGAGPAPLGVSKEQHLMDTLAGLAEGRKPELARVKAPKVEVEPEATEPEAETEETPKPKRKR